MNKRLSFPCGKNAQRLQRAVPAMVLWAALCAATACFGQTVYTATLFPHPLEYLGHSVRALGMGGAFAAADGDAACLYYNPAGLGGLESRQWSLTHHSWIQGITQETLLASLPLGKTGCFALGANYLRYGTFNGYDETGASASTLDPFRGSLSLGFGGRLFSGLAVGISARGHAQSLEAGSVEVSSSLQVGALCFPVSGLRLGASYAFLDTGASPEAGLLRAGLSWSAPLDPENPALVQADFTLPLYTAVRLQLGVEQYFLGVLAARLGCQWELEDNQIPGFRGPAGGLGFKFDEFRLDYGFMPEGVLGSSHMFGLTYFFKAEKSQPINPPATPPTAEAAPTAFPAPVQSAMPALTTAPTKTPAASEVSPPGGSAAPPMASPSSPRAFTRPAAPNATAPGSPMDTETTGGKETATGTSTPLASLDFNPSSGVSARDHVIKVETFFEIPDIGKSTTGLPATPSPEMQKTLEAAGKKVEENTKDVQAWLDLGNLYWQSGQPDYTLQCFREALRLQPDLPRLKEWIGRFQENRAKSAPGVE